MTQRISIFDVSEELLDQLYPARPAVIEPEAVWVAEWPKPPRKEAAVRHCSCCGVDTTLPDLCQDCVDVGWFA